jgi:hypothetical protein
LLSERGGNASPHRGNRRIGRCRHDTDAAHRAQADALEIEAAAKRQLADEYDGAQERKEIRNAGKPNCSATEQLPGNKEIGIPRKLAHEARAIATPIREPGGLLLMSVFVALEPWQPLRRTALCGAALTFQFSG